MLPERLLWTNTIVRAVTQRAVLGSDAPIESTPAPHQAGVSRWSVPVASESPAWPELPLANGSTDPPYCRA